MTVTELPMTVCRACGEDQPPGAEWCTNCGEPAPPDAATPASDRADPSPGHQPEPFRAATVRDRLAEAVLDPAALKQLRPPAALVYGLLYLNSLVSLYGRQATFKTALILSIAKAVATGTPWHGRRIHAGPVVYVAAEGVHGIGLRFAADEIHSGTEYDPAAHHPIHFVTIPVPLTQPEWVHAFTDFCAEVQPALIVIDTFARCSPGADENSSRDVGEVIEHVEQVRRATGACVVLVHHAGKDTAAGSRGSTALPAAVSTEVEVTRDDSSVQLRVRKQKDAAEGDPIRLTARVVQLDQSDDQGQPLTSIVLVPDTEGGSRTDGDGFTGKTWAVLEALRSVALPGGVPNNVWRDAAGNHPGNPVVPSTYYVQRKRLVEAGFVRNIGTDRRPLYVPVDPDEGDDQ